MLLAAVDNRLAAAAVCMGNLENVAADPFLPPGATDDAEQDLVGGGPLGLDRWDLLYPFAPKPLLIWPSDRDYFATYSPNYIQNAWQEYGKLKQVYAALGQANQSAGRIRRCRMSWRTRTGYWFTTGSPAGFKTGRPPSRPNRLFTAPA